MENAAQSRMGAAAVAAGTLLFLGQSGELVFGDESRPVYALLVGLLVAAVVSFEVAFWNMQKVLVGSRTGRVGARIGVVGGLFLLIFAVQLAISAVESGDVPDNFALFGLGFLLILVAQVVVARPLASVVGGAWWLSLVAAAALLVALVANEVFIWHDLGLIVFEACWVAMGWLTRRGVVAGIPVVTPGS